MSLFVSNTNAYKSIVNEKGSVVFDINIPGQSRDEIRHKYDEWISYEDDILSQDWQAPHTTAAAVEAYYPPSTRQDVKIFDIGAGTGLLAQELRKVGFMHLDALDASPAMLDVARQKGLYDRYMETFLSAEPLENVAQDSYDILTGSGCFSPNHIPYEALREVLRVVKPGGMVFLASKHMDHEYCKGLYQLEDELQAQGKWIQVERSLKPVHRIGFQSMLHVYRVL